MPVQSAVKKGLEFRPHKMRPRDSIAHADHGTYTVSSSHAVQYTPKSGNPQKLGKFGSSGDAVSHAQEHHASVGKSVSKGEKTRKAVPRWHAEGKPKSGAEPWRKPGKSFPLLMSLDDYYDAVVKDQAGRDAYHANAGKVRAPDPTRTAHVDKPPPATSDVSSRAQNERRVSKFPRKMKPTVSMKPISNEEAMTHLRSGAYNPAAQKSLRWLVALKALATGYGKASGGGALKAANRGRSLQLLGPSGRAAGKSGGHYRKRRISGKTNFGPDGRAGPRADEAQFGKRPSSRLRRAMEAAPSLVGKGGAPLVVHSKSPRAVGGGAAAELSNSLANVVIKSEGAEMTRQNADVDFDDLFKSELASDHLVDCPHCEAPITKGDLAKAHKGKGAVTHQSGPKHGKSSAHVRDHNPEGGTTRGGDGRGVHKPSRGVPGAKKTDAVVGVQNDKGSRARKGGNDDASSDAGSDDVGKSLAGASQDPAAGAARPTVVVRGTDWVQYVDDGSDARIAKAIAEGALGGTNPTRPLDLNNDLTRLLI